MRQSTVVVFSHTPTERERELAINPLTTDAKNIYIKQDVSELTQSCMFVATVDDSTKPQ